MKFAHLYIALSIAFVTPASATETYSPSDLQIYEPWLKIQKFWRFLETTTTHSGESPLNPGEGWLALVKSGSGWNLVRATVSATRVPSDITDYDIKIEGRPEDAIAFLRLPNIKIGPVPTPDILGGILDAKFYEKVNGTYPSLKFAFGGELHQIKVIELSTRREEELVKFGALVVQTGSKSSRLGLVGDAPWDESVAIEWMGDIDGDGKLDLITRYSGSNSGGLCLHLSGAAPGNAMFAAPICHIGTGC